ncbi:MAG: putative porin [Flavobacteriales bacterium]
MKKGFLFMLLLLVSKVSFGQTVFQKEIDTVKSTHRTGGTFDTLSNIVQSFQSTFFISPNATLLSPFQLYASNGSTLHSFSDKNQALRFSALPHLGFSYAFGAQGAQRLKVDFQEAFRHGLLLNLSFDKTKGNGFLRNDAFSFQQFNGELLRTGKQYSMDLRFSKEAIDRSWSNGLFDSIPISGIALDLQTVRKENAHSMQSLSALRFQQRFDFNQDSTIGFGLLTRHAFYEYKRDYQEVGDLTQQYSNVYWNSDSTQDRFHERSLSNDAGVFLDVSAVQLQSTLGYHLRQWHDQQSYRDTAELWWKNEFSYRSNQFKLTHRNALNIAGAGRGITAQTTVLIPFTFLQLNLQHQLSSSLPELMQRNYQSNNVQYQLNSLEKQWNQSFKALASKSFKAFEFTFAYQLLQFRKVYIFDQQAESWRNDLAASTGVGQSLRATVAWTYKGLQIKPAYQWTHFSSGLNFQPEQQSSVRVQWKGGVFKAKKLHMLFAADVQHFSPFKQLNFIPQMGVFDLTQTSSLYMNSFVNVAFTTALEVETFRFFVRIDNIGRFWTPSTTAFVSHYAFPSMQIKIGLTWDFWN